MPPDKCVHCVERCALFHCGNFFVKRKAWISCETQAYTLSIAHLPRGLLPQARYTLLTIFLPADVMHPAVRIFLPEAI